MSDWIKIEDVQNDLRCMEDEEGEPVRFDLWVRPHFIDAKGRLNKQHGYRVVDCFWHEGQQRWLMGRGEPVEHDVQAGRIMISHLHMTFSPVHFDDDE